MKKDDSWVYIDHNQVECPNCKNVIITPPGRVSKAFLAADPNIYAEKEGKCCRCGQEVTFRVYGDENHTPGVVMRGVRRPLPTGDSGIFHCKRIGLAGTTDIFTRFNKEKGEWEARQGFALFGSVNNLASVGACPFDENFHDNYGVGRGKTKEEAKEALQKDLDKTHEGLWAEPDDKQLPPDTRTEEEIKRLEEDLTKRMLEEQ